jgi:endonuclease/exonuclease/phosphatase family metal-dependent hydrolase
MRIRVMTLNIVHGWRRPFPPEPGARAVSRNLDAIAAVVAREAPDVVAFQEIDDRSWWSGDLDETAAIAARTGYAHRAFGAHRTTGGRFHDAHGTALLSLLPLENPGSFEFRTSRCDDKGFVVATIAPPQLGRRQIDVVSVHLDPFFDGARRAQVERMAGALSARARGRPLVVVGDMNCAWNDGRTALAALACALDLRAFFGDGAQPTYSARTPWRRIDWILASPELAFADYRTLDDVLSDHRAVVADLTLRAASCPGQSFLAAGSPLPPFDPCNSSIIPGATHVLPCR